MIEKAGLWWNGGNTGTSSTLTIVTTTLNGAPTSTKSPKRYRPVPATGVLNRAKSCNGDAHVLLSQFRSIQTI
jgi:hypothetical protein